MLIQTPNFSSADSEPFSDAQAIAGFAVSLASLQNRRESNDDRAAAIGLDNVPAALLPQLADKAMRAAEIAVADIMVGRASGATAAIGVYNPADQKLFIRSRGDSPIYVVLHDDKKAVAIRVTYPADAMKAMVFNSLKPDDARKSPVRKAVYALDRDPEEFAALYKKYSALRQSDAVDTGDMIKTVAPRFGMKDAKKVRATLVVASDGLEKAFDIKHAVVNDTFALRVADLARSNDPNPAHTLAKEATEKRNGARYATSDNTTLIFCDLPQNTAAQPLAFMVADGFDSRGGNYAQAAVTAFVNTMEKARPANKESTAHVDRSGGGDRGSGFVR